MADYRVGGNGRAVTILSKRAAQRGLGPRPKVGFSIIFETEYDTAQFVRASECEGYIFEGKEALPQDCFKRMLIELLHARVGA